MITCGPLPYAMSTSPVEERGEGERGGGMDRQRERGKEERREGWTDGRGEGGRGIDR